MYIYLNKKNNLSGFTLIELLVVVAILGILSSLVLAGLSSSREKAKIVSVQSTLASIQSLANTCLDDGDELSDITDASSGGGFICTGTLSEWPALSIGWTYDTTPDSSVSAHTFIYSASDGLGNYITCDETNGCVVTLAS